MKTIKDIQPPSVALEYAREVRKRLGGHARRIILFGSQARGEASDGSDYDFIVVLDHRTREARDLISDAGIELLNERDAMCAALIYDESEWRNTLRFPLGWNVEREGVLL